MADNLQVIYEKSEVTRNMLYQWVNSIDVKPRTRKLYKCHLSYFFNYLDANKITSPKRSDVLAYKSYLVDNYKPATIQFYLNVVHLFFKWADSEKLYPNIAVNIKKPKRTREHKKDNLTEKQAAHLLSSINDIETIIGKRDYAMIALLMTTGIRLISLCRANIEDIRKLEDEVVLYYQGKGKDEKSDYVKLSPKVHEAIIRYLKARKQEDGRKPLFVSSSNFSKESRLNTQSVSRIVRHRLIVAGLKTSRITSHSLRHTAATLNLLNGASLEETQQLLGHVNINTTMIYAHALKRKDNNSEYRISNAIFDNKE